MANTERLTASRGNLARYLALVPGLALCAAALAGLVLALVDADHLAHFMAGHVDRIVAEEVGIPAVAGIQHRALVAAALYGIAGLLLLLFSQAIFLPVIAEIPAATHALRARIGGPSRRRDIMIITVIAVLALMGVAFLDQPMRFDESTTFLNYGTRPFYFALGTYLSPNNHILHSLLMRLSVMLFGEAPWAIRLPAFLAGILFLPLCYAAARTVFGRGTAAIATLAIAGSPYWLEQSTNARGYTMVLASFAALVSLTPPALRGNAAAIAGFVVAGALGGYAVPVMAYPFSIVAGWALLMVLFATEFRHQWPVPLFRLMGMVIVTGLAVLFLYSPAIIIAGIGGTGPERLIEETAALSAGDRFAKILINLHVAWEQWLAPLPSWAAIAVSLLAAAGFVIALVRAQGRERYFALAVLPGPLMVSAATGFAALPHWSLPFLFPVFIWFAALTIERLITYLIGFTQMRATVTGTLLALAWSALNLAAGYPENFVHAIGSPNGKEIALAMGPEFATDAEVLSRPQQFRPVQYYLREAGHPQNLRLFKVPGNAPASGQHRLFVIDWIDGNKDIESGRVPSSMVLVKDVVIGRTRLRIYEPPSAANQGVSP